MKVKLFLTFLLIHFLSISGTDFENALDASNKRDFKTAAFYFEKELSKDSTNTSVYFNLGNCYYELKEYGKAIWAFEKVLKFKPSDEESVASIESCYSNLSTQVMWKPSLKGIERIIVFIGSNTFAILAVVISLLMAVSIYKLFHEEIISRRRFHKILLAFEFVLLIFSIYTAKLAAEYSTSSKFAIVTKKSIPAFSEEKEVKESMIITEGEKLQILESGGRLKVQRMDGTVIWVESKDIARI